MSIVPRRAGQPLEPGAVEIDAVYFIITIPLACKTDPIAARRPCRKGVKVGARFELVDLFRGDVQYVQVAGSSLCNPIDHVLSVRGPTRHSAARIALGHCF